MIPLQTKMIRRARAKPVKHTGKSGRMGDVLELMHLLWALDHGLQTTSKRMAVSLGVTGPQRLVIRIVGRFPNISAGALADNLCLHPSTLTGILQRLKSRGILISKQDPDDGRRTLLSLTKKGLAHNSVHVGTVEAAVRRALSKISRRKISLAREVLKMLSAELLQQPDATL